MMDSGLSDAGVGLCSVTAICSWARHLAIMMPLESTQGYKCAPANLMLGVTQ